MAHPTNSPRIIHCIATPSPNGAQTLLRIAVAHQSTGPPCSMTDGCVSPTSEEPAILSFPPTIMIENRWSLVSSKAATNATASSSVIVLTSSSDTVA